MAQQGCDKEKFAAAIFRRGQKKELFEDGDGEGDAETELAEKLHGIHEVWGLPRSGCVDHRCID